PTGAGTTQLDHASDQRAFDTLPMTRQAPSQAQSSRQRWSAETTARAQWSRRSVVVSTWQASGCLAVLRLPGGPQAAWRSSGRLAVLRLPGGSQLTPDKPVPGPRFVGILPQPANRAADPALKPSVGPQASIRVGSSRPRPTSARNLEMISPSTTRCSALTDSVVISRGTSASPTPRGFFLTWPTARIERKTHRK